MRTHPKHRRFQPGERYYEWTTIRCIPADKSYQTRWLCRCSCGNERIIQSGGLRNGKSRSCGCAIIHKVKHGLAGTPTYMIWAWILQRCNNPKATAYKHYGGRGIKVCSRWLKFENFYEDMGLRPDGLSIERKDNNGDYCKENCTWATREEQSNNKQNTRKVTHNGKTQTLMQWAKELGINNQVLYWRFHRNWPIERLLTKP